MPVYRFAWRGRDGIPLPLLALEMLSIIIAVAVGFLVTEWREERHEAARAETALTGIEAELRSNREHLAAKLPYYERVHAALDSLAATHGDSPLEADRVPDWRGLNPPFLGSSAYRVASVTGTLALFEFRVADQIARAYMLQEMIQKTVDWTLESVIDGQLRTWEDGQRAFQFLLEVCGSGVQTYDAVLRQVFAEDPAGG